MYADPSGHFAISTLIIGTIIGLVVEFAVDYFEDNSRTIDHSLLDYLGAGVGGAISENVDYNLESLKRDLIIGVASFGISEGITIMGKKLLRGWFNKAMNSTTKKASKQLHQLAKGRVVNNLKPNAQKIIGRTNLYKKTLSFGEKSVGVIYSFITGMSNSTFIMVGGNMYKNQKSIFKGYLILILGIILSLCSIVFILIYSNILKNPLGDIPVIISFISIFMGIFLIISSSEYNIMLFGDFKLFINPAIIVKTNKWFIQGVPNNNYNEFDLKYNELFTSREIIIKEKDNGIFILNIRNRIIKFNMKGWLRKEYYIYEYILSILQLNCKNKVYKTNIINEFKELKIIFIRKNGKNNTWFLVKHYKTCLTTLFKIRLKTKCKILSLCNKKEINNINNYYHFNKCINAHRN